MKISLTWLLLLATCASALSQVDTTYIYNTSTPYGTLDIRIRKSSSRYYYLKPDQTFSYRESSVGVKTNTFRDMTSWDSSPYTQGTLQEKNGTADYFIMNYRLLFPNNYNSSYDLGYPLIVMMHGLGERGNCWETKCYHATTAWKPTINDPPAPTSTSHQLLNNDHNLLHGGKQHLDARNAAGTRLPSDPSMPSRAFPGFVLFPQNLNGWTGTTVQDAIRLVRLIAKKYKIDPDRIYIHGLSNGGVGTYEAIKRAPWLFAAALPMSAPADGGITSKNLTSKIANIPLWIFQGGIDTAPTPTTTERYVKRFRDAGMSVRYTKYDHLGHGVWNTAYREPDFFSWMLKQNKSKLQIFADNPAICTTNGKGVTLRLADGFLRYQWERNGVLISGANSGTYVATTPGTYRARFSRYANPTASQWNDWSQDVVVTEQSPAQAKMNQSGTVLLKDLNNYGNAHLIADGDFAHYYWYRNGALVNIGDTLKEAVIKPGDCSSGACSGNGEYTLVVSGYDDCPSPPSASRQLYFNNQAPINLTAPVSFNKSGITSNSVKLTWTDGTSGEVGFEIWRRKVLTSTTFSKWTMPVLTAANATTFIDTGLEPSSTYQYKIRAAGKTGRSNYTPSSSTSYLVVTTGGDNVAPSAPTNLTAQVTGVGKASLTWNASADDSGIKEYVVLYETTSVNTGSSATNFTVTDLPINKTLNITVKAKDLAGNLSSASNSVMVDTRVEGLYYEHSTGAWANIDAINWNIAEFNGKVTSFTLSPRTQEDYFNFHFDGFLYIIQGGSYEFSTASSDGSRVELDGVVVVNNDGVHGTKTVYGTALNVNSGARRIIVKYFEYDGTHTLTVRYRGPDTGGTWKTIPSTALTSSPVSAASIADAKVIDETQQERIAVYPNPATPHDLNVKMEDAEEGPVQIRMVDLAGRPIYEKQHPHHDVQQGVQILANQPLPNGLYVIVVREQNHTTKRIVAIRN